MEKKWKWFLGIVALFVFIGGAYLLYNTFADTYQPNQLITLATTASQTAEQTTAQTAEQTTAQITEQTTAQTTAHTAEETTSAPPVIWKAPNFRVFDKDGNEVSLSDFLGKPVVVNFWASWCPPCQAEMPDFEKAYQQYGDDIHFLMVNMTDGERETVNTAKAYIAQNGYTFPVYFDTEYEAAYAYQVYTLPATYFFDKKGNLVVMGNSMLTADMLAQGIGMIYEPTK